MRGLDKVEIDISVILGGRTFPLQELLRFGRGALIDLDTLAQERVSVCANAHPIAEGRIVSGPDSRIGVEITRLLVRPGVADATDA